VSKIKTCSDFRRKFDPRDINYLPIGSECRDGTAGYAETPPSMVSRHIKASATSIYGRIPTVLST
jgi:hypothetical protein